MKSDQKAISKRTELIKAISTGNKVQLQALTKPGKRVAVLDTFLDGLIWTSQADEQYGSSIEFIETENFKSIFAQ